MQMVESPKEEDAVTLEIKADIQIILSALCENDLHRKVEPVTKPKSVTDHACFGLIT